jgi:nucleoside-diphosphate-sugar epimerase
VIIGSGSSVTVMDVVTAARKATGAPIPATHVASQPGEMRAVVLDTGLARSRGWAPTESLVEGLRAAWADFAPVAR